MWVHRAKQAIRTTHEIYKKEIIITYNTRVHAYPVLQSILRKNPTIQTNERYTHNTKKMWYYFLPTYDIVYVVDFTLRRHALFNFPTS